MAESKKDEAAEAKAADEKAAAEAKAAEEAAAAEAAAKAEAEAKAAEEAKAHAPVAAEADAEHERVTVLVVKPFHPAYRPDKDDAGNYIPTPFEMPRPVAEQAVRTRKAVLPEED